MFRILFDLPRSSIWHKDLLLDINPYKTLKNVHMKRGLIWGWRTNKKYMFLTPKKRNNIFRFMHKQIKVSDMYTLVDSL